MSPALDWGWAARCRLLGGNPTRELFEEALAAGEGAVPLMVDLLSRRSFREGRPADCAQLPVHAMRVLGALRAESAIPALVNVITDPVDPGLHGEEAANALGRIGAAAIAPLEGVLADRERDTWVRSCAARALVFCALGDRRLRPRVLGCFERRLLDPRERDRILVAHVVTDTCLLAALRLMPGIVAAYRAGRADEDTIDLDAALVDLGSRHHRPDHETKTLVRRDVREDYAAWDDLAQDLPDDERRRYESEMARLEDFGAEPPEPGELDDPADADDY